MQDHDTNTGASAPVENTPDQLTRDQALAEIFATITTYSVPKLKAFLKGIKALKAGVDKDTAFAEFMATSNTPDATTSDEAAKPEVSA